MSESIAIQELRRVGLRATAPRCAVLDWLQDHPHATAEQVYRGVIKRLGTVSMQTVYGVLAAYTANGLVRRIGLDGHPAHFELRRDDNHHHVTCRRCGRIEDVCDRLDAQPCLTSSQTHGFRIDDTEVVFRGLCPQCRRSLHADQRDTGKHHHRHHSVSKQAGRFTPG